ncbi:MAG: hypothetical protein KJ799_07730, partial [Bacteroidetes bacterium]|nr:hypothetical protein [Bacteroidota bacterium]
MNVHFYIDRNKRASDDRTIWAYISERDRSFLLHTNAKVNFNYWDKKQQRAQVKGVKDKILQGRLSALNSYLSELENKLLSIADKLRTGNVFITFDEIEAEIKKQFSKKGISFFDYFDEFITVK